MRWSLLINVINKTNLQGSINRFSIKARTICYCIKVYEDDEVAVPEIPENCRVHSTTMDGTICVSFDAVEGVYELDND